MKTSQGKLAVLAFLLLLAALLLAPMRAGLEDSLVIEPSALKMNVGDSYLVRCALSADDSDQKLSFTSSNDKVASIGPDGTVYALASGEAVIGARASGGAQAQMTVSVSGVPMRELTLNTDYLRIEKGQFSGLRASFNSDASDARLQWVSADERIVRVDAAGRVEGVGGGTSYVSAIAPNGLHASAKVFVHVTGTAVHISPNNLTLGVGAAVPLKVSYLPLDCTDRVRRWTSSDAEVLSVDADGVLHARGQGSAYLSVLTEDGQTSGMIVKVEAAPEDLQLDPTQATLERGSTLEMQLMFLDASGKVDTQTTHLVVWTSSDAGVASVDQSGRVTALASGESRITATSDGMSVSCQLKVEVNIHTITLDREGIYLLREDTGAPIQLNWTIDPADADDPTVSFESNNEQVALVSQQGLVTLTGGYGTAVVTASSASGAQARFTVNVVTQLPETDAQ